MTNFSTRRQRLAKNAKVTTSTPATAPTPGTSSSPEEEEPLEFTANSAAHEDFPKDEAVPQFTKPASTELPAGISEDSNGNYFDSAGNNIYDLESYLAGIRSHTSETEQAPQKHPQKSTNRHKKRGKKSGKQHKTAPKSALGNN